MRGTFEGDLLEFRHVAREFQHRPGQTANVSGEAASHATERKAETRRVTRRERPGSAFRTFRRAEGPIAGRRAGKRLTSDGEDHKCRNHDDDDADGDVHSVAVLSMVGNGDSAHLIRQPNRQERTSGSQTNLRQWFPEGCAPSPCAHLGRSM